MSFRPDPMAPDEYNIYVKKENEDCMYCPSCGKQSLHMNAQQKRVFGCSKCQTEFAMLPVNEYIELKGGQN